LGLDPSRQICDIIDDFRLYATIQKPFNPRSKVVQDLADAFFLLSIRDPDPTPCTNPILWWLAVLVHSDVHRSHPRLPVPDLEDSLDLTAKLDALDHYSRVLVFHNNFINWTTPPHPLQPVPRWKHEVPRRVDAVDIAWVNQNREAPRSDVAESLNLESPAWSDYQETLKAAVNDWLVADTEGPMCDIIACDVETYLRPDPHLRLIRPELLAPFESDTMQFRTGPMIPAPYAVYTRVPPKSVTSRLKALMVLLWMPRGVSS
jgi:hypothetical protein